MAVGEVDTANREVKIIRTEFLCRNCGQMEDEDEGHFHISILGYGNVCEQCCTFTFRYQQVRQLTGEIVRWTVWCVCVCPYRERDR